MKAVLDISTLFQATLVKNSLSVLLQVMEIYDAADAAKLANEEATAGYGNEVLESLGMLDKNLGDAVQTASGDAAASMEAAAGIYNEARMTAPRRTLRAPRA